MTDIDSPERTRQLAADHLARLGALATGANRQQIAAELARLAAVVRDLPPLPEPHAAASVLVSTPTWVWVDSGAGSAEVYASPSGGRWVILHSDAWFTPAQARELAAVLLHLASEVESTNSTQEATL